jgi:uncharacterized membrane protein HdeD (DUF308 family)
MSETRVERELHESTSAWWLLLVLGTLCIVAGVLVLAKPSDSLETLSVIVGVFLLVDGCIELGVSLSRHTESRGLVALIGVLNAIIGVILIRHPIAGVAAMAILVALWLLAIGIVRFVTAFEVPEHRGWNIAIALIEVAGGVVILVDPDIGLATLALLVGLAFIVRGVALFAVGWAMHVVRGETAAPSGHVGATAA